MPEARGIFEQDIVALYREIFGGLPSQSASLLVGRSRDPAGGEEISLTSNRVGCATIRVHVSDRSAYMFFGRGCRAEIFASDKRERKSLKRVRDLSEAVINGNFSEDIWYIGSKIVKSVGHFTVQGRPLKLRYWGLFNPLRNRKKKHYTYLPYF